MAIETNIPSSVRKLIFETFFMDIMGRQITIVFRVENSDETKTFRSETTKWKATLNFLFDNLTNAADLKGRIEDWLIANGHVTGIKVPD